MRLSDFLLTIKTSSSFRVRNTPFKWYLYNRDINIYLTMYVIHRFKTNFKLVLNLWMTYIVKYILMSRVYRYHLKEVFLTINELNNCCPPYFALKRVISNKAKLNHFLCWWRKYRIFFLMMTFKLNQQKTLESAFLMVLLTNMVGSDLMWCYMWRVTCDTWHVKCDMWHMESGLKTSRKRISDSLNQIMN